MDYELLRTILQAISSLAIAGGLIFTAVHVANFTKLIEMQMALRRMMNDPGMKILHDAFQKYVDRLVSEMPARPIIGQPPRESV